MNRVGASGIGVLAAVGLTAGLARRWLRQSLPQVGGTVAVVGTEAPVTIVRDREGVPNIDAGSMADAAFAMGFVHAQDRLWQMELTRRVGAGRLSEFAGLEAISADRFLRRVGLMRVAVEEEALLDQEARTMLDAYAAGVNAVIGSGRPLPIEFGLTGITPEPWCPRDSIVVAKVLALSLSMNWDNELQRLDLLRAIGPERAAGLDLVYPEAHPTILAATATTTGAAAADRPVSRAREMFAEAARWIPGAGGGSNAWVVAGSRTASGRPLLCNDPHLTPSVPSLWYAAHIRAGEDFQTTGVTLAGLPFPLIGHNQHCAWGCTNSCADVQDLIIEEFDGPEARRYRTEHGYVESRVIREEIIVKGGATITEEVIITRHGPVVERLERSAGSQARGLALQWTALTPGGAVAALLRLQRATDWTSFREAFTALDAPSQNVVYADSVGHVGYLLSGRIPVRRRLPSGLPVSGWTGDALWERFLSMDEVPQLLDPADGVIVTANNRVVGKSFPHYIANDYLNGYRAARLATLLDRYGLTPAVMAEIQQDTLCLPAVTTVSLLKPLQFDGPLAESARRWLAAWDGNMDPARREPALYEAFVARLAEHALRPLCGDAWRILAGTDAAHPVFGYPGNLAGRLLPGLLDRWAAADGNLFGDQTTWTEVVERSLRDAVGDLGGWDSCRAGRGRRWGRMHRLTLTHALSARRPLNLLFNAGTVELGGNIDTVFATAFVPGKPYRTGLWAPSWRMIMDVGNWEASTGIHFPGQSGQRGSAHYRDLTARWLGNQQLPLAWSPAAVRRVARATLQLVPIPTATATPRPTPTPTPTATGTPR